MKVQNGYEYDLLFGFVGVGLMRMILRIVLIKGGTADSSSRKPNSMSKVSRVMSFKDVADIYYAIPEYKFKIKVAKKGRSFVTIPSFL
ncbi:hypothetical protein MMC26_001246 [Xylographa opegraphella]|nr:hypothetical protein [Xylographa opegraphella]